MEITYRSDALPPVEQIIALYNSARLPRPVNNPERMQQMFAHSDIVITAWHDDVLVGVSRAITDWVWCCYLADLAVHEQYQKAGIGKQLIRLTREKASAQSMLLLLSVPDAMDYYPRAGFKKIENGFMMGRSV
ncbi:GNAT family N-acetyltransferase [Deminuibacter soli]|uniref:N-acetyltransferase n=1 Tax=Deminuibacter soli TaxID=2291815 RepID=A0A3E1NE78_9BACT|nr:GNAT family N-acetyltransferase [Deminuibacter soli]RFM26275.1 N-acetyltransferase [Deminuibacter soli]